MKNILFIFTLTLLAVLLPACGPDKAEKEVKAYFTGNILELHGGSALVHATREDGKELGQISIGLSANPDETFHAGDRVKVGYEGVIMETAPAKVIALTVEKTGDARAAAWDFIREKSWDDRANGWQNADVHETMADDRYVLLDEADEGREALVVSFEDAENTVTGTPLILVDRERYKVIGYMPGE